MLVLSRKLNESIVIDGDIRITVVRVHGCQVRLGIEAPRQYSILREELRRPEKPEEPASALETPPEQTVVVELSADPTAVAF